MSILQRLRVNPVVRFIVPCCTLLLLPLLLLCACIARYKHKPIDVGLGPHPLINNIYHKRALQQLGYTVETFVYKTYFISHDFDIRAHDTFKGVFQIIIPVYLYLICIMRYKVLYIYFNGGPLGPSFTYRAIEPFLYKIAKIKVVVMPYGGDVQDITKSDNLLFRNALAKDYPSFQKQRRKIITRNVDMWTKRADHIISGCDWVYYMHHWDTLTLAHFSIDMEAFIPAKSSTKKDKTVTILHAPNHKAIKGSDFFIRAVEELKKEGYDVALTLVQNMPNDELKALMRECDIIADQLIIGWYAMTALEGMCFEKPVLCHLDPKLIDLYTVEGLIGGEDDIPLVNCDYRNVKGKIRWLLDNPKERKKIGKAGRKYVQKHHSLEAIGTLFDRINRSIGVAPSKSMTDANIS